MTSKRRNPRRKAVDHRSGALLEKGLAERWAEHMRAVMPAAPEKVAAAPEEIPPSEAYERPRRRLDCLSGGSNEARPCPWVSCPHHLYLDQKRDGTLELYKPELEVWELEESCVLDIIDRNGGGSANREGLSVTPCTLEEVGNILGVTRERIRQVEARGFRLLGRKGLVKKMHDSIGHGIKLEKGERHDDEPAEGEDDGEEE